MSSRHLHQSHLPRDCHSVKRRCIHPLIFISTPRHQQSATRTASYPVLLISLQSPHLQVLLWAGRASTGLTAPRVRLSTVLHFLLPRESLRKMTTMTINRCSHDQWVNVSMYCPAGVTHGMFLIRRHLQKRRNQSYNPYSRLPSKIHRRLGTLSVHLPCTQSTPRHVLSIFASVSAVVSFSSRPLLQHSPSPRFPFFAAIRTSFGCMRPFQPITLGWLFLLFLRRALLDASMASSSNSGGP